MSTIKEDAFRWCKLLKSVTLGNNIRKIYDWAFASCEDLTDVFCYSNYLPSVSKTSFEYSYIEYATLHVPSGSLSNYKTASIWKDFGKIVSLTDKETNIKVMENESIIPSDYFLVNGQQMETLQKGINIVKTGKKIMKVFVK